MPPHLLLRHGLARFLFLAGAICCACVPCAAADNPAEVFELPVVRVIGTTPLPGLGTPLGEVPANVQVFTARDLRRQGQTNVGEYLEANATSVTINSAQGNPFQSDINFRGFTASPLLGTPQGLSVFQDGVRINEPFGDIVNWDLIPPSAISSMQLIPGSNPVFGLNTLGGALAIYTKSGSQYPGAHAEAYAGAFGRKGVEAEYGGSRGNLDYFVTGNYVDDRGWAQHNPSTVRQFFGKLGWQDEKTDLDLSLTAADNALQGTQTLPQSWSDDIRQAYTFPDLNRNKLTMLTAKGSRFITDDVLLGGNLYYRKYTNQSVTSNVNGDYDPIADPVQASNDRSAIDQTGYGLGVQLTVAGGAGDLSNRLSVGASADIGKARFTQDAQTAAFSPTRGTIATSDFGRTTDAATHNQYYGVFFTDTMKFGAAWALTASARYNRAAVRIEDLTGATPLLNGEHAFARLNPALGATYSPSARLTAYVSYNEGMRVPTPIELTCADPAAPCKLPNNFIADPELKKVVSRTIETGARGKLGADTQWSAAIYRTLLADDIQFISSGGAALNAGFFQNVGNTQRDGLELAVSTRWSALAASASYGYVNATFESPFTVNSPNNSAADADGNVAVRPGSRIPGIPRQSFKLRLQYEFEPGATIAANALCSSSVYARGDESNQDANGRVPGYVVLNLDGRYRLDKGLELFARVNNLFDRKYANFGILGRDFFTGPGHSYDGVNTAPAQFRGYGIPRGAWLGLQYQWL